MWWVSTRVNTPKNDDPDLLVPFLEASARRASGREQRVKRCRGLGVAQVDISGALVRGSALRPEAFAIGAPRYRDAREIARPVLIGTGRLR